MDIHRSLVVRRRFSTARSSANTMLYCANCGARKTMHVYSEIVKTFLGQYYSATISLAPRFRAAFTSQNIAGSVPIRLGLYCCGPAGASCARVFGGLSKSLRRPTCCTRCQVSSASCDDVAVCRMRSPPSVLPWKAFLR